jgi:hypothetical protein
MYNIKLPWKIGTKIKIFDDNYVWVGHVSKYEITESEKHNLNIFAVVSCDDDFNLLIYCRSDGKCIHKVEIIE